MIVLASQNIEATTPLKGDKELEWSALSGSLNMMSKGELFELFGF